MPKQPGGAPTRDSQLMSLEALSGYFENLAAAATNEKLVLEDLVANLTTLATSNAEMEDMIKKLTGENWQLQ